MKQTIRFLGVFAILYMVFSRMTTLVKVHMNGWQFIIFVIVLTLIVEYSLEKGGILSRS